MQADTFFEGRYREKAIQVDSSKTGKEEDEMIERLLAVESTEELTEIVIHVNMLKEGWDVTNLYTIVPLRAANARILIEQSIGRGLRLPYGSRTGVSAVDRLNIVAHDKFQEIIEEANKPGSAIRLQQVMLTSGQLGEKTVTVVSQSQLTSQLGIQPTQMTASTMVASTNAAPVFASSAEQRAAQIAYAVIRKLESQPQIVPSVMYLQKPEVQAQVVQEVTAQFGPAQLRLPGVEPDVDVTAVVAQTTQMVIQHTIDISRILVVPTGKVQSGFRTFVLNLTPLNYPPPSDELWIQHLRTNEREIVSLGKGGREEARLEDYVVSGLVDYDDVSYDDHADLLYDLATQTANHFRSYLSEEDTRKVFRCFQRPITQFSSAHRHDLDVWAYLHDALEQLARGTPDLSPLLPDVWKAAHPEHVRTFREQEKENRAAEHRYRRAARRQAARTPATPAD